MLYPNEYFGKVEEITIEFLRRNEIKALILDVDNTLIDYNKNMSENVIKWANELKSQGIKLYILSNTNKKEKVETVANKLKIPYRNLAKKPMKSGFLKVQKELDEKFNNIDFSKLSLSHGEGKQLVLKYGDISLSTVEFTEEEESIIYDGGEI